MFALAVIAFLVVFIIVSFFQQHLQVITGVVKEHIADDTTLIPGHPVLEECAKYIEESAVFVAVVSADFCGSFYCNIELSEAQQTGKPIILIFKEHVNEALMGVVLRNIFLNKVRARIEQKEGGYKMVPDWDRLCKAIIGLMNTKN